MISTLNYTRLYVPFFWFTHTIPPKTTLQTFLFCFSLTNIAAGLYFLPQSAKVLVDRPYQDQLVFGGAFFSMVTALGPRVTFFGADHDDTTTSPTSPDPAAPVAEMADKKED